MGIILSTRFLIIFTKNIFSTSILSISLSLSGQIGLINRLHYLSGFFFHFQSISITLSLSEKIRLINWKIDCLICHFSVYFLALPFYPCLKPFRKDWINKCYYIVYSKHCFSCTGGSCFVMRLLFCLRLKQQFVSLRRVGEIIDSKLDPLFYILTSTHVLVESKKQIIVNSSTQNS